MTVSLHHELPKSESCEENETCCTEGKCCNGVDSLLGDLEEDGKIESEVSECDAAKDKELNNNMENCERKFRRLLRFHEAPGYLAHNKYILSGYRGILSTKLCLESIFWWTNETINIWSHIFGFLLFAALTIFDVTALNIHTHFSDKLIVANVLACFMACMILSSMYHTFSCRSEKDFHCFLSFDLFGISLSLLAIYTSGIYFAFWCHQYWQQFYIVTVTLIFGIAMLLQLPSLGVDSHVKMLVFVAWAAYGVVPTIHWTIEMGGLAHPVVELLLPRVLGMYLISGTAFFIYLMKIPERFCAGKFDYLGHSHQWWHIIIVIALYYWHCSGVLYVNYRISHACTDSMRID